MIKKFVVCSILLLSSFAFLYAQEAETGKSESVETNKVESNGDVNQEKSVVAEESPYSGLSDFELEKMYVEMSQKKKNAFGVMGAGLGLVGGGLISLIVGVVSRPPGGGESLTSLIWTASGVASLGIGAILTAISVPVAVVRSNKVNAMEDEKIKRRVAGSKQLSELSFKISPAYIGVNFAFGPKY